MGSDPVRLTRHGEARGLVQARFEREHAEQRAQARFARRLRATIAQLGATAVPESLAELAAELSALRSEARERKDDSALAELDKAEQRLARWHEEEQALAGAVALVTEAERLAAQSAVDLAKLPERWQALEPMHRTPALAQRFAAAVTAVEQHRLARNLDTQQKTSAARQHIHSLLHAAEQALAAGQLQAARAAADKIKPLGQAPACCRSRPPSVSAGSCNN